MKLEVSFDDFGEEVVREYELRRPNIAEMSMMMKQATQQQDMIAASKSLVLSLMDGDEKQRFNEDMAEFPGIAVAIMNKLTSACGLTANVAKKN